MDDYFSASKAAKKLGVSDVTVSTWCRQGRIPGAFKVSNMWLIPVTTTLDDIDTPKMGRPPSNGTNGVMVSNQES